MRNLKILFSYLGAYRRDAILGVFFVTAETALELFIPVIMANIIDVGIKNGNVKYVVTHGLFMLGLGAVGLACGRHQLHAVAGRVYAGMRRMFAGTWLGLCTHVCSRRLGAGR